MFWMILIIIAAIIVVSLDSIIGKIVIGATVLAIGLLILRWITGWGLLIVLAKLCAAVIVIVIVGAMLAALKG